jgi:hypothetical protein
MITRINRIIKELPGKDYQFSDTRDAWQNKRDY